MTRKRFVKLLMATGLPRNAACYNAVLALACNQTYQHALEIYAAKLAMNYQVRTLLPLLPQLTGRKYPWNLS